MRTLAAALPILAILWLMVFRRWSGHRAGLVGWLVAVAVAALGFGAPITLIGWSQARGLVASLDVLAIIWAAFALSHVVAEAGALEVMAAATMKLTSDRPLQLLALAWPFASLVQGVTGFGVPIAVVAPLLVQLGFPALGSVVATAIGHAWAISFGSLGSSMAALSATTGIPVRELGPASAAMLGAACVASGFMVAIAAGGRFSWLRLFGAVLVVGGVMAFGQWLVARTVLWNLAAFLGALGGLAALGLVARVPPYRTRGSEGRPATKASAGDTAGRHNRGSELPLGEEQARRPAPPLCWALAGYGLLVGVVLADAYLPHLARALDSIRVALPSTTMAGTAPRAGCLVAPSYSIFGSAGALIGYSCLAAYAAYARRGYLAPGSGRRIAAATVRSAYRPTLAILVLMPLALTMADSGMTDQLAAGIGRLAGASYPLFCPWLGALGAFVTGSNTHSNVLFGQLQRSLALGASDDPALILAGQNVGAAVGSVLSPAKVAVASGVAGMAGQEAELLRHIMRAAWPLILFASLLVFFALRLGGAVG